MYPDLPRPTYKARLNKSDAANNDIIQAVEANFSAAVKQTEKFAQRFRGSDRTKTARNIWNFLKQNIRYQRDPSHSQLIRMPSRFIADGTGDCKSYSLLTAAILANLGMPVSFRYASYTNSTIPQHVYVTTQDERGREIVIDAVYTHFNREKRPTHKFDHVMNVYTLSGTDDLGRLRIRIKKPRLRVARFIKTNVKSTARKAGKVVKSGFKAVKKGALIVPRQAFRGLVAINARGLATNLAKALQKDPNRVRKFWERFGGNFSDLVKTIRSGAKRKRIGEIENIGDPTMGASLAAAAPIVVAAIYLLKQLGVKSEKMDSLQEAAEMAAGQFPDASQPTAPLQTFSSGGGGGGGSFSSESGGDMNNERTEAPEPTSSLFTPRNILIGAAVVGGIVLLTKKSR